MFNPFNLARMTRKMLKKIKSQILYEEKTIPVIPFLEEYLLLSIEIVVETHF